MRPERIRGTHHRAFYKMLKSLPRTKRIARFLDGHIYSGHASSHLAPMARRFGKLRNLRSFNIRPLAIQLY
jgi:hypothetical protein